jgi:hypothetical protein
LQSATYVLDRWAYYNDVVSKRTIQQVSTAPAGFTNSMLVTVIATDTVGPQQFVYQAIEGLNASNLGWGTLSAKNCTLSFWVRSSVTGQMGGSIQNYNSARSYPFAYTINTANTWEYKTVNISGDTSGTWLTTNGIGLRLMFENGPGYQASPAGSWVSLNSTTSTGSVNLCATNGATWYITGVQFEVGTQATPFDWRPFGTELQLCQRYFCSPYPQGTAPANNATGYVDSVASAYSSSVARCPAILFPVEMRATPTITFYRPGIGTTNGQWVIYVGGWTDSQNTAAINANARQVMVEVNRNSSLAVASSYLASGGYAASAEL